MTRKSIFSLLVACLFITTTFAQNLQNSIPKDATFVMTMNPSVLNSKVKFSKLKEFDFFKMGMDEMTRQAGPMADEIKKFINDPASFGMDMMSSSYAFGKVDGKNVHMAYILKVADKSKFDELIQTYVAAMVPVEKSGNMEYVAQEGMNMAWNNNQIVISGVELEYEGDEDYTAHKERKQTAANEWMKSIMAGSGTNSIATHATFKMANVGNDDFNFFADYETFAKMSNELQGNGGDPMAKMMMESMSGLYKDSYMSVGLNFDKGQTKLKSNYFMNDEALDIYRQISDAPFNKKFLKYMPKNNLGFMSFNFNLDKLVNIIKSSENPMLAQYPVYESMALEGLKGMGVDMTSDEVYKLWNGDVAMVVTGMKEFEKEVTTYEFDDDFNKKEVKELRKEKLPEFVMMMSHKNKGGILKLIDLAKQSSMITPVKGYFKVAVPDMPMDVFMKVEKDMILVSNNLNVVTKKAKKVFKKKNLMKVKDAAKMMTSSTYMVWNIPATMNVLAEMDGVSTEGPEGMMMNMGKDSFNNITISADKKIGKSLNSVMNLNFNNKSVNSLEQIFGLINDVFTSMGGGSSM